MEEPPFEAKFQRPVFQISMRLRYGLAVDPAIPNVRVQRCGAVRKGFGFGRSARLGLPLWWAQSSSTRRVSRCVRAAIEAVSYQCES